MFGKIIDGKLVIAGKKIQIENGWITNPTEEDYIRYGYKEVNINEKPEYDDEEQRLKEVLVETDVINICYEIETLTDEEHNQVIQYKIIEEENKITPRNLRGAVMGDSFAYNKVNEVENNIAKLREKLR